MKASGRPVGRAAGNRPRNHLDCGKAGPDPPGCLYIELEPGTASRAAEMGAQAVIAPSLPVSPGYPCAKCEGDPYDAFCRIAAW